MVSRLRNNTLVAGSLVYLTSNILNAAIPFLLLPVLTRYLEPEAYGQVAMFQTLMGALSAFIGLSMAGAAGRKFYDGNLKQADLAAFIGACLQILLVTTSITLAVVVLISNQLSAWLSLAPHWVIIAVLVVAAQVVMQLRLGQWQVRKKARQYGVLQVSQSLLNMLLSLLLVVILLWGADGFMSAQALAAGSFALLALWLLNRDGLLLFSSWRPDYIREALSFGVPLIPHVGGVFLLGAVGRFVINAELGLADAGIYMVAVQMAAGLGLIFVAINKAFVPWLFERLSRNNATEKRQIVLYTYTWYAIILAGAGMPFFVGPWLVVAMAGEAYARAGDVIGWLALGQVLGGMYLMVTNYIFYSKRTGLLSLATIVSGLVNVALLLILVQLFGLRGAAYAFCIAMGLRFVLTWWVAQYRHPMPWFQIKS